MSDAFEMDKEDVLDVLLFLNNDKVMKQREKLSMFAKNSIDRLEKNLRDTILGESEAEPEEDEDVCESNDDDQDDECEEDEEKVEEPDPSSWVFWDQMIDLPRLAATARNVGCAKIGESVSLTFNEGDNGLMCELSNGGKIEEVDSITRTGKTLDICEHLKGNLYVHHYFDVKRFPPEWTQLLPCGEEVGIDQ